MKANFTRTVFKKSICVCLAAIGVISGGISVRGLTLAERLDSDKSEQAVIIDTKANIYADVLKQYEQDKRQPAPADALIHISAADGQTVDGPVDTVTYLEENDAVLFKEDTEYIKWNFTVRREGIYQLKINYVPADDSTADIIRSLYIDDEIPYDECAGIHFTRRFCDEGEPVENSAGDEMRPSVKQIYQWSSVDIFDNSGLYTEPLRFYLTAGEHSIKLESLSQSLAISELVFHAPLKTKEYAEVFEEYKQKGYTPSAKGVKTEAEKNIVWKSSSTIRMQSNGDPKMSPRSLDTVRMNCIGDTAWMDGNSAVTWEFEAPEDGLYELNLRMGQWYREGMPSYRRIEIDGRVPFTEFESVAFTYNKKWRSELIKTEAGDPYAVYLTKGRHELTMTVNQGNIQPILQTITDDSALLSDLLLRIVMVAGQNPDPNYDYHLETRIPNLTEIMQTLMDHMSDMMEQLKAISGDKTPAMYNQLKELKDQLLAMVENPYSIPMKTDDINTVLTTYGDWISWLKQEPLIMDYFEFLPYGEEVKNYQAGFFPRFQTAVVQFIRSFISDYDSVDALTDGNAAIKEVIDVWIARGKDWGTLIKRMADESFTPDSKTAINMHILPSGQLNSGSANALLLAISSGMAPDAAMGTPAESVGEFAIRNAVADLSQFEDFSQVAERFRAELFIPVTYKQKVYALPETMNFRVLIYRKDILASLGLALPKTWDELYNKVIPVLYQNNMQFYFPSSLEIMLFQLNGEFYNEEGTVSALDSPEAFRAFKEMCELYTVYGVPVTANFFNRMRTGEMPIGVGDFMAYMQLKSAAPELEGRWGITLVPGHRNKDGSINHSQGAAVSETCMIMEQSDKQPQAWEFLKWWTSKEVQTQFGNEIEALNGIGARWNTANTEAFAALPWPRGDYEVMDEALSQIGQIPPVLGGYFTTRHLTNAFNRVVVSGENVRDSLEKAVKDINKELRRKQQSYGEQQTSS